MLNFDIYVLRYQKIIFRTSLLTNGKLLQTGARVSLAIDGILFPGVGSVRYLP